MKLKVMIVALVIIVGTFIGVMIISNKDDVVIYDNTISESMMAVNFTIRRNEAFNGIGDFEVEDDYTKQGVVDIFFDAGTNKKVKLVIGLGRKKYTYDIENDPKYIYFPLQLGSGTYDIEIYENVKDDKYKKVYSKEIEVIVEDPRIVYLNTIQIIDWQVDKKAVEMSDVLLHEEKIRRFEAKYNIEYTDQSLDEFVLKDIEKIRVIYRYVVETIRYDFAKLDNLQSDYIPDIEDVFNEKEGICYDYSAILASMLRRHNIPTKLIKGYTTKTDVFHAWNEVYVEDENRWIIIDTTYDSYMFERRKTFEMEKSPDDYTNVSEY